MMVNKKIKIKNNNKNNSTFKNEKVLKYNTIK